MSSSRRVLGWREWVGIPDFDNLLFEAKISTGITDSILYSFDIYLFKRAGETWVSFYIDPDNSSVSSAMQYEARVASIKSVTEGDGSQHNWPVIRTSVVLGGESVDLDLVIIKSRARKFRIVLGQSFLCHRYIVDSSLSFSKGYPQK